jgi:hypothetical protein
MGFLKLTISIEMQVQLLIWNLKNGIILSNNKVNAWAQFGVIKEITFDQGNYFWIYNINFNGSRFK